MSHQYKYRAELYIAYAECTRVLALAPEDECFVLSEAKFVVNQYFAARSKTPSSTESAIMEFSRWVLLVAFAAQPPGANA